MTSGAIQRGVLRHNCQHDILIIHSLSLFEFPSCIALSYPYLCVHVFCVKRVYVCVCVCLGLLVLGVFWCVRGGQALVRCILSTMCDLQFAAQKFENSFLSGVRYNIVFLPNDSVAF